MKRKIINVLLLFLGLLALYNAYDVLAIFFSDSRGYGVIYRLGLEIFLNGQSLLGYGLFFMVLGVLFLLAPMLINRIRMKRRVIEKV